MTHLPGTLLKHLPAVYHSWKALADVLALFEEVLFGSEQGGVPGLEQQISRIPDLVAVERREGIFSADSSDSPKAFLAWLAGWVAFGPYAIFSAEDLRRIVPQIVPLYSQRGTKTYLESLLKLCLPDIESVMIDDAVYGLVLGYSTIGDNSFLAPDRPFRFRVVVRFHPRTPKEGPGGTAALEEKTRVLIEFAKPAHTTYELRCEAGEGNPP